MIFNTDSNNKCINFEPQIKISSGLQGTPYIKIGMNQLPPPLSPFVLFCKQVIIYLLHPGIYIGFRNVYNLS